MGFVVRPRDTALLGCAALLLCVSVTGKILRYGPPVSGRDADEARIVRFLEGRYFKFVETAYLSADRNYRMLRFTGPDCPAALGIAAISTAGDAASMLRSFAGTDDRLIFVYDGRELAEPPSFVAAVRDRARGLLYSLGMAAHEAPPFLAVIAPSDCRAVVPWSEL
jgi:hypothetical protein